jgi:hypothetical protein
MSKTKLNAAKELIREKKYDEARVVLNTMPNDSAAKRMLDQMDRPTQKKQQSGTSCLIIIGLLIFFVLVLPRNDTDRVAPTATQNVDSAHVVAQPLTLTPMPTLTDRPTQTIIPSAQPTTNPTVTLKAATTPSVNSAISGLPSIK